MIETPSGTRRHDHTRVLSVTAALVCGVIAGPLFVTTFLIAGAAKAGYSPLKHDVSALELGDFGWIQSLNFVVAGVLTLIFAAGLRRELGTEKGSKWGPRLIGLWATGLVGSGIFITDPIGGYPPGSPTEGGQITGHGVMHNICAGLSFISLLTAIILFTRMFAARRQRCVGVLLRPLWNRPHRFHHRGQLRGEPDRWCGRDRRAVPAYRWHLRDGLAHRACCLPASQAIREGRFPPSIVWLILATLVGAVRSRTC